ncbi:MAG TPA: hypothetical protein DIC35_04435 [Candidatus Moranbacteria bacterium]|nr:hypothetical protein [Candidatus Moranbacteria bacterium]
MQNIAPNVAAILHIARGYLRCYALYLSFGAIHRISADIQNSPSETLRDFFGKLRIIRARCGEILFLNCSLLYKKAHPLIKVSWCSEMATSLYFL